MPRKVVLEKFIGITLCLFLCQISHASIANLKPTKSLRSQSRPKIRVRIKKELKQVTVQGLDLKRKLHFNENLRSFEGRKAIRFNCLGINKKDLRPTLLASLGSSTGLLSFADEKFLGTLHLISSTGKSSCDVIHETDIENYLSTLLAREMNAKWPIEVLKAQAIAARTYALHKMESKQVDKLAGHQTFYHIESSEKHQVSGSFLDTNDKTDRASLETSGLVLVNSKKQLAPVFFHASCGGHTLTPDQVWSHKVDGYKAVKCPYCQLEKKKLFNSNITISRWKDFLNWLVRKKHVNKSILEANDKKFWLSVDEKFNRNIKMVVGKEVFTLKKSLLRRYFGRGVIPSNNFTFTLVTGVKKKAYFKIQGSGNGHGVGMCQLGALHLARKGMTYKEILAHYFPGHQILRVY